MARMQRAKHLALWLRLLSESEISLGQDTKKLLKAHGKRAAIAYKNTPSIPAVVETIENGFSDWRRVLVAHYGVTIKKFHDYTSLAILGDAKKPKQNFATRIQNFIEKQGLDQSKLITATTVNIAKKIIQNGQTNGDGEELIGKALEDGIGGDVADFRARTIARTEVHNAATFSMQETAEEIAEKNSLQMTREWVAVEDDRTRPAHAEADGQEVGMDESFEVDDESLDRPGDSDGSPENIINCRCTLIYHTSDGGDTDNPDGDDDPENDVGAGGFIGA